MGAIVTDTAFFTNSNIDSGTRVPEKIPTVPHLFVMSLKYLFLTGAEASRLWLWFLF